MNTATEQALQAYADELGKLVSTLTDDEKLMALIKARIPDADFQSARADIMRDYERRLYDATSDFERRKADAHIDLREAMFKLCGIEPAETLPDETLDEARARYRRTLTRAGKGGDE